MSEGTFEERLVSAMALMANPQKLSTATVPTKGGGKFTYKYETLEQVLAAVRPPLLANGIGLTQAQEWSDKSGGYVLRTVVFDEGTRLVMDERPIFATTNAQEAGSWETYMRRYALRSAFGLCGEDDDGEATTRPRRADERRRPDKRSRMLSRCEELSAQCLENGMNPGATESYMTAHFKVGSIEELTDEQLVEFGKYLATMVEQSANRGAMEG
nr:ERF family protein [uncultured Olsenella sp.]